MKLMSSAFPEGGLIPRMHTCDSADLSPALEWRDAPAGTLSFVLIVDDPDAPVGTWNHWLLYDIPAETHSLSQGWRTASRALTGKNDFGKIAYGGPCPPKGHGPHRYFFKLHALDVHTLGLPAGVKRADLDKAIHGHTLAEAQYMGRYERR